MYQYLDLLDELLCDGNAKGDRTGTGVMSKFGHQMRFDLSEGFPLVTTKKVHVKSVIHELLWILSGSTNIKYLNDNGVRIWNEWSNDNGDLGPVYGQQFKKWGAKPSRIRQPVPECAVDATYLCVANGSGKHGHYLAKTWEGMIARCYDKKSPSYQFYGAKGVHVCDRWLEFSNFAEDAVLLPGWNDKAESETRYVLDKDELGNGFVYRPESCQWITDAENERLKWSTTYTVEKNGVEYSFTNVAEFCRQFGCEPKNFSDLWTGNKNAKVRNGFRLVKFEKGNKGVNQIQALIDCLIKNPYSRRHIVSAWNVADLPNESLSPQENVEAGRMALAPCHTLFQFYVHDGKLSCQLYQRSADVFLGLPFNIASYALLTHMIAQQCDLNVGEFIWTGGDVHLYSNHVEQARLQLTREPRSLPHLIIKRRPESIFDYHYDDFEIVGYDPHLHIKAEVSI